MSVRCWLWCQVSPSRIESSLRFVALTALVALLDVTVDASELPLSPINLTVEEVFSTAAVIRWTVTGSEADFLSHFQFILQQISYSATNDDEEGELFSSHLSRIIEVPAADRSFLIQYLVPDAGYRIFAASVSDDGRSNFSEPIEFHTPAADGAIHPQQYQMHSAEVVIIVFILSAWLSAVGLFLHKWRRIRILPPREPRFKHNPKNLDTIKVVKRPTDSIIYKSYTKQISTTMQARQKKLERMSTMPNIKVTTDKSSLGDDRSGRSTLFTVTEGCEGIRPSASGPAAFEVFERLLVAPSPTLHPAGTLHPGTPSGATMDVEAAGRKRMKSDSDVIRMAKDQPETGRTWARDMAGHAAKVMQAFANRDKENPGYSGRSKVVQILAKYIEKDNTENVSMNSDIPKSQREQGVMEDIVEIPRQSTDLEETADEKDSADLKQVRIPNDDENEANVQNNSSIMEEEAEANISKVICILTNWDTETTGDLSDGSQSSVVEDAKTLPNELPQVLVSVDEEADETEETLNSLDSIFLDEPS